MPERDPPAMLVEGLAAALVIALAAAGLPYLLRGLIVLPGPRIEGAPLDELSRRADISVVLFAGIWICAGILIAAAFPSSWRTQKLLTHVVFVTFAWQLVTAAISLGIVRQVSTGAGIAGALELAVVYVAPCCAAVGAALVPGRRASR